MANTNAPFLDSNGLLVVLEKIGQLRTELIDRIDRVIVQELSDRIDANTEAINKLRQDVIDTFNNIANVNQAYEDEMDDDPETNYDPTNPNT